MLAAALFMVITECSLHVSRELAQGLVEVVHLSKDAAYDHDNEDVG
jgi:hypothetical protein